MKKMCPLPGLNPTPATQWVAYLADGEHGIYKVDLLKPSQSHAHRSYPASCDDVHSLGHSRVFLVCSCVPRAAPHAKNLIAGSRSKNGDSRRASLSDADGPPLKARFDSPSCLLWDNQRGLLIGQKNAIRTLSGDVVGGAGLSRVKTLSGMTKVPDHLRERGYSDFDLCARGPLTVAHISLEEAEWNMVLRMWYNPTDATTIFVEDYWEDSDVDLFTYSCIRADEVTFFSQSSTSLDFTQPSITLSQSHVVTIAHLGEDIHISALCALPNSTPDTQWVAYLVRDEHAVYKIDLLKPSQPHALAHSFACLRWCDWLNPSRRSCLLVSRSQLRTLRI